MTRSRVAPRAASLPLDWIAQNLFYRKDVTNMAIIPKGSEPANIKKRLDTLFAKLDCAYPDKVIQGLQKDHKKWAETVRELYRLLGYPDGDAFLNAYGYTVVRGEAGRPKGNYDEVTELLKNGIQKECPSVRSVKS